MQRGAGDVRCKDLAGDSGGLAGRDTMSMLTMIAAEGARLNSMPVIVEYTGFM